MVFRIIKAEKFVLNMIFVNSAVFRSLETWVPYAY